MGNNIKEEEVHDYLVDFVEKHMKDIDGEKLLQIENESRNTCYEQCGTELDLKFKELAERRNRHS